MFQFCVIYNEYELTERAMRPNFHSKDILTSPETTYEYSYENSKQKIQH